MDNQPSINRDLLIPIVIAGFSVLGIIVVLLVGRALNSPPEIPATPSATPFQYVYLGTEPAITTPLIEESIIPFPTDEPIEPPSISTAPFLVTNTPSNIILRTNTPRPTSTIDSTAAAANTYDDTDARLTYIGNWVSQTDVVDAYQETLHISTGIGNSVTFTFTGPEIHLFYQAGPSLGSITITIDSLGGSPLSQAQDETEIKEWVPTTQLSTGTHVIVIAHFGGGSVNIDSLVVPGATPTPNQ